MPKSPRWTVFAFLGAACLALSAPPLAQIPHRASMRSPPIAACMPRPPGAMPPRSSVWRQPAAVSTPATAMDARR